MRLRINQRIVLRILQEHLIDEGSSGNDIAIEMIERMLEDNKMEWDLNDVK